MALEKPDLILNENNYIEYITHSVPGQMFYYQRKLNFNIKFIESDLKVNHNITVKYLGSYDEGNKIYKLRVIDLPKPEFDDEKLEQKTIFFDPVNLTS